MSAPVDLSQLTDEQVERIIRQRRDLVRLVERQDMRDKGYQDFALGQDVAEFLRSKRKSAAENTVNAYESTLDKFVRRFSDLTLQDFAPPVGTERLEEWLDGVWGRHEPATYNRHLHAMRSFFRYHVRRGHLPADPTEAIDKARQPERDRETFATDHVRQIIVEQEGLRDRIALRLLLNYGLRRGTLQAIQFKHFDHIRKRLTVFLKGGKVRVLPIPEPGFWDELGRHVLETEAQPSHYLMCATRRNRYGVRRLPDKPMSGNGLHKWWYRCLQNAGIVPEGVQRGERMHKARHTAGQALLDATGNIVAVQRLLGHESIQTTASTYVDWDVERLSQSIRDMFEKDGDLD